MSDIKLTPEDHFETSDINTLIVASKLCPLSEQEDNLIFTKVNDDKIPCCKLNGNICKYFIELIISDISYINCSILKEYEKFFILNQNKEKLKSILN